MKGRFFQNSAMHFGTKWISCEIYARRRRRGRPYLRLVPLFLSNVAVRQKAQACSRRRQARAVRPAVPMAASASVEGSGTTAVSNSMPYQPPAETEE